MTQYVLLSADLTAVVTLFHGAQPAQANYAEIADDDARYVAFRAAQAAPAVLAGKLAAGIAITSTATPALNATYALDPTTLDQVGAVARDYGSDLGLPLGLATFTYPDQASAPHTFAGTDVQHLYKAMRDLVATLNEQAAVLAAGGTPSWPAQTATIA